MNALRLSLAVTARAAALVHHAPPSRGAGSLTISTGPGCPWQASSLAPWITLTAASGAGPGAITFTVAPNYNSPRDGQIVRTDDSFHTVSQQGAPPGEFLISEFRIDGPNGPADEFVELYNNTDSPVTVSTSDGSAGWSVVAWLSTNNAPPAAQNFCTLPAGSVSLASPLAPDSSVNVHFLLGVVRAGGFQFVVSVEALP